MQRLLPNPGPTTVEEQLEQYSPWEQPRENRPFVATNFAVTVDGRATVEGRSGPIGSELDTKMLARLRTRFDALMIGAGTMRVEQYGRVIPRQEERERLGLAHDLLMVLISGRLDLPWEAPLFTAGGGRVLIFTASDTEPPQTATSVEIVRNEDQVDMAAALRDLREEHGVRALLCEGGPHVHSQLWAAGLVDELFLTTAPRMTGAEAPRILEGAELPAIAELELAWLLEHEGELFARYKRR